MTQFLPISYMEPPVTKYEKEIACLLETLIKGYNEKNKELIETVLHSDARIYEPLKNEGKFLSKNEYVQLVINSDTMRKVFYRDVYIRIKDERNAAVSYKVYVLIRPNFLPVGIERLSQIVRDGGSWKVLKISPFS